MKKIIILGIVIAFLCGSVFTSKHYDAEIADLYSEIDDSYYYGYEDGTKEGYDEGYERGRSDAAEEAYSEGYEQGFSDGEDSVLQWQKENFERYEDGYEYGLEVGYSSGYEDGLADGNKSSKSSGTQTEPKSPVINYVLNKNTKKFHLPWCASVDDIKSSNRWDFTGTRDEVIAKGYVPCKRCYP